METNAQKTAINTITSKNYICASGICQHEQFGLFVSLQTRKCFAKAAIVVISCSESVLRMGFVGTHDVAANTKEKKSQKFAK